MSEIEVTDPYSGAVVTVSEDSPQAKAWRTPEPAPKRPRATATK